MKGLFWKDYRLNRGLFILGAVVVCGIYLVGLAIEIGYGWPALPAARTWADAIYSYGHLALGVLPFLAAILGGNAIACERADRSAHFLAYLPPTKGQIVVSKLAVAAAGLGAFWVFSLAMMYAVAPLVSPEPVDFLYMVSPPAEVLAGCLLTFGIGWLGSAWLEKPTVPAMAALVAPFALGYGMFLVATLCGISRFDVAEWAGVVSLVIGTCTLAAGTWFYVRRVEP